MRKSLLTIIIITFFSNILNAEDINLEDRLKFDFDMRYRLEVDDRVKYFEYNYHNDINGYGYQTKNGGANEFNQLRTQIGLNILINDRISTRFKVQESRYLGTTGSNNRSSSEVELHEAHFIINDFFSTPFTLQFGRYQMNYGRGRVIGADDFSHYGPRAFDGFRFKLEHDSWFFHFFVSKLWDRGHQIPFESESIIYPPQEYEDFYKKDDNLVGVAGSFWYGLFQPIIYVDYARGSSNSSKFLIHTIGFYSNYELENFCLNTEFYYQGGEFYTSKRVESFLGAADLTYTMDIPFRPFLGSGLDIVSGYQWDDSEDRTGLFFRTLSSSHDFNGHMHYFSVYDWRGLNDYFIKAGLNPDRYTLDVTYHFFHSRDGFHNPSAFYPPFPGYYKDLGNELDIHFQCDLYKNLSMDTAWCYYWPGKDWEKADADNSSYFYLSIITKF